MARFRLEASPIPLHHQVYLDLRAALDEGEWPSGSRLPTERELARRYGCSLVTVRRALGDLTRERRLERTRGRGTFVTTPPLELDLVGTTTFTEEVQRLGHDPETRVVTAETVPADATVAAALAIPIGGPAVHLERLRMADGEPLLLEGVFLPAARFHGLLATDLEAGSLYRILSERYGTTVVRARESIEPIHLSARVAALLGVDAHRPALLIEGVAFDRAGRPVEYARSYVRGDRTRYYVERVVVRSDPRAEASMEAQRGRAHDLADAS